MKWLADIDLKELDPRLAMGLACVVGIVVVCKTVVGGLGDS